VSNPAFTKLSLKLYPILSSLCLLFPAQITQLECTLVDPLASCRYHVPSTTPHSCTWIKTENSGLSFLHSYSYIDHRVPGDIFIDHYIIFFFSAIFLSKTCHAGTLTFLMHTYRLLISYSCKSQSEGTILYIFPSKAQFPDTTYKYPSGPTSRSVIPPSKH
jgi:hypothetical protein